MIPVLNETCKDRILTVQKAARDAMQEWNKCKNKFENVEEKKLVKK